MTPDETTLWMETYLVWLSACAGRVHHTVADTASKEAADAAVEAFRDADKRAEQQRLGIL